MLPLWVASPSGVSAGKTCFLVGKILLLISQMIDRVVKELTKLKFQVAKNNVATNYLHFPTLFSRVNPYKKMDIPLPKCSSLSGFLWSRRHRGIFPYAHYCTSRIDAE